VLHGFGALKTSRKIIEYQFWKIAFGRKAQQEKQIRLPVQVENIKKF